MSGLTLGISYGFHDASAALVRDGRVVAAAAEERFSRQKHDRHFPWQAIDACLRQGGVTPADLAAVGYHERPEHTFSRVLTASLAGFPGSRAEFVAGMKSWLTSKLWVRGEIGRRLGVPLDRIHCFGHHESHAAQAFFSSGWDEAAVLTVDAVGEWASTTLSYGATVDGRRQLTPLREIEFPHSLGLFYSAMTAYLGFVPMDGECSTMALAAFGEPRYLEAMRRIVRATDDGYEIDQTYFNFVDFYREPYTKKLLALLGPPRRPGHKLAFASVRIPGAETPVSNADQHFADVAASVQRIFEDTVLRLAQRLRAQSGSRRLCLAGGAALNCVANTRIFREAGFDDVYIPPDPGDGGAAAGAGLLAYRETRHEAGPEVGSDAAVWEPARGVPVDAEELNFLDFVDEAHSRRYAKVGLKLPRYRVRSTVAASDDALATEIAADLAAGRIVGWCQGGFESGPRALGSRSILIRADDPALADRLSREVKDRAAYRPYALSVAVEDAAAVLEDDFDGKLETLRPLRWMQMVARVRADARAGVQAALHVDGTTRPQVVRGADHPIFHRLLTACRPALGRAALLNTSFNESGAPLVGSAVEALAVFCRTSMDVLVVGRRVLRKEIRAASETSTEENVPCS